TLDDLGRCAAMRRLMERRIQRSPSGTCRVRPLRVLGQNGEDLRPLICLRGLRQVIPSLGCPVTEGLRPDDTIPNDVHLRNLPIKPNIASETKGTQVGNPVRRKVSPCATPPRWLALPQPWH